jgi:hypothetical protein
MSLTNDDISSEYASIVLNFEIIDFFNSLLLELNNYIKMFKDRALSMNNYIPERTHDWSEPLDCIWKKVYNIGEKIEAFLLYYKNSNTKDVIYKYMVKKINIANEEFQTCITSLKN